MCYNIFGRIRPNINGITTPFKNIEDTLINSVFFIYIYVIMIVYLIGVNIMSKIVIDKENRKICIEDNGICEFSYRPNDQEKHLHIFVLYEDGSLRKLVPFNNSYYSQIIHLDIDHKSENIIVDDLEEINKHIGNTVFYDDVRTRSNKDNSTFIFLKRIEKEVK